MNKPYLKDDIRFSFSFDISYINEMEDGIRKEKTLEWENNCEYNAIIKDVNGDIFIELKGFSKDGNENSISFINRQWNDYIPYFEFGRYLKIHQAYINEIPIRLDLSSTHLRGMVSASDCYCRFYIDKYQYSYAQENEKCSTSYYLSETSKNLVCEFWGLGLLTGDVEPKKISLDKDLSCIVNLNNNSELLPIKIEYNDTKDEVEKEFGLLCDIISFYYAVPIECCMSVECVKELVKITRTIPHYNLCQETNYNENLCYLNYGISHRFIDFLTTIYENRKELEGKLELLHTTMNDYVRSFGLDERSRFLVLYSVLETDSKSIKSEDSVPVDKIEHHHKMETVFNNMYSCFIESLRVEDNDYYRKLWDNAKCIFSVKEPHSIVKLFNYHNIDNDKINIEIKKANIISGKHKIKNISDLRNRLVHNRNADNLSKLPMDMINSKLSFCVCIVLLCNLGFSNIAFHKDWFLLSVLKK